LPGMLAIEWRSIRKQRPREKNGYFDVRSWRGTIFSWRTCELGGRTC
jgi:hypothetical protein